MSHSSIQLPKGSRETTKAKVEDIKPLDAILYLLLYYEDKNVWSTFVFLQQVLGDISRLIFVCSITPSLSKETPGWSNRSSPSSGLLGNLSRLSHPLLPLELLFCFIFVASPVAQWVKNLLAMQETQETWVWSLGWEDLLEEEMTPHSSILAWKIPWTEEPGRLQSTGCKGLDMIEHLTHTLLSFF